MGWVKELNEIYSPISNAMSVYYAILICTTGFQIVIVSCEAMNIRPCIPIISGLIRPYQGLQQTSWEGIGFAINWLPVRSHQMSKIQKSCLFHKCSEQIMCFQHYCLLMGFVKINSSSPVCLSLRVLCCPILLATGFEKSVFLV